MNKLIFGSILALIFCVSCAQKSTTSDPVSWQVKGAALADAGEHRKAAQAYDQALSIAPDHVPSLRGRAQSHMLRGDFLRAEQDYAQLAAIEPANVWNVAQRGLAKSLSGDHVGAVKDFSAALIAEPGNLVAMLNRGFSRYELGQYAPAVDDFSSVLTVDPESLPALYYRARSASGLTHFSEAVKDYARIYALEPAKAAQGASELLGDRPEALEGLVQQALMVVDKGRTLPVLDCIARFVLGKKTLACISAMP